jgi:hypothetical protein
MFTEVVERQKKVLDLEYPETLINMGYLALVYKDQGRYGKAEVLFTEVLERQKKVVGAEHPDTLTNLTYLALTYKNQGR